MMKITKKKDTFMMLINIIRERTDVPAAPAVQEPSEEIFDGTFKPLYMDSLPNDMESGESLGPLEPPMPSPAYRRNFTGFINTHAIWNEKSMQAFRMLPYTPDEVLLPTEAKFLGSSNGFRPIGQGEGGSGKPFSQVLGGNTPSEQFTVVMLTYRAKRWIWQPRGCQI